MITPRHIDDQQLAEGYLADQLAVDELDQLEQLVSNFLLDIVAEGGDASPPTSAP